MSFIHKNAFENFAIKMAAMLHLRECVNISCILHVHISYMYHYAANMQKHNPTPNASIPVKCENDMTIHTNKINSHWSWSLGNNDGHTGFRPNRAFLQHPTVVFQISVAKHNLTLYIIFSLYKVIQNEWWDLIKYALSLYLVKQGLSQWEKTLHK